MTPNLYENRIKDDISADKIDAERLRKLELFHLRGRTFVDMNAMHSLSPHHDEKMPQPVKYEAE